MGHKKGKACGNYRSKGERLRCERWHGVNDLARYTQSAGTSRQVNASSSSTVVSRHASFPRQLGFLKGLILDRRRDDARERERMRVSSAMLSALTQSNLPLRERRETQSSRGNGAANSTVEGRLKGKSGIPSLLDLCIKQIGKDFSRYHGTSSSCPEESPNDVEEQECIEMATVFSRLPLQVLVEIALQASSHQACHDHNISLLCWPGVHTLNLIGDFTDTGAEAILPMLTCHRSIESEIEEATVADDWENADEYVTSLICGCPSLQSIYLSSPEITGDFIIKLVHGLPLLQIISLKSCPRASRGGGDVIMQLATGLPELGKLDLSNNTWFGDCALLRFAQLLRKSRSIIDWNTKQTATTNAHETQSKSKRMLELVCVGSSVTEKGACVAIRAAAGVLSIVLERDS